jgi:Domain of unknown function (DUF4402)
MLTDEIIPYSSFFSEFLMNKFLALVAIIVCGTLTASAQKSAGTSAKASATIVRSLSVEANQDLDFGFQAQGVGEVTIAASDAKAVKFTITGEENMDVMISYSSPSALINQNGSKLPFNGIITAHSDDAAAKASDLSSGDVRTLNGKGNHYVYLGGTIDVAKDQDRGFYTAQFDINVEYTF